MMEKRARKLCHKRRRRYTKCDTSLASNLYLRSAASDQWFVCFTVNFTDTQVAYYHPVSQSCINSGKLMLSMIGYFGSGSDANSGSVVASACCRRLYPSRVRR